MKSFEMSYTNFHRFNFDQEDTKKSKGYQNHYNQNNNLKVCTICFKSGFSSPFFKELLQVEILHSLWDPKYHISKKKPMYFLWKNITKSLCYANIISFTKLTRYFSLKHHLPNQNSRVTFKNCASQYWRTFGICLADVTWAAEL